MGVNFYAAHPEKSIQSVLFIPIRKMMRTDSLHNHPFRDNSSGETPIETVFNLSAPDGQPSASLLMD
jgi:hypothetical protein